MALTVALFMSPALSVPVSAVQVTDNPWFGAILTDDAGRALYVIGGETQCADECLLLWAPVPAETVTSSESGLDREEFGLTQGPGGKPQATFDGRPLFYFAEDFAAGDTNGHHFEEFGSVGFLISPEGVPLAGAVSECGCHVIELARN